MVHPPPGEERLFGDALPFLLWTADARGRTLWANRAWRTYSPGERVADLADLALPEDRHRILALFTSDAPTFEVELALRDTGDQLHWFRLHGQLQQAAPDGASSWLISGTNIDDLRQEQHRSELLQGLIDASPNCIKVLDLDARLLSMNEGGQVTMEIDDFSLCRHLLWPTFWEGEARDQVELALDRARRGQRTTFEARTATFKGTPRWWEVSVAPLYDVHGRVSQISAVSRDITSRRDAQDAVTALDAFVRFTEAVGSETDRLTLVRQAMQVLRASLDQVSAAYYELDGDRWAVRLWSEDLDPQLVAQLQAGVPRGAPTFAAAARSRVPVFAERWDAEREAVPGAARYGAVALLPTSSGEQVTALLTVGTRQGHTWTEREQAIIRAVGHSLDLALERADAARRVLEQKAELAARTQALEGFAELTHDLALESDPGALIQRSMELVLSLLPPGYAAFYQLSGPHWRATRQVGSAGSPELQATIEAGFAAGQTPTLDVPFQTKAPWFQDVYDPARETRPEVVRHIRAVASLPVLVGGGVQGILVVPLFGQRHWSAADRAMLITTVRSLGLALESARGLSRLAEERRKLEAANEELEAFAYSVSHDLRTPVRHILGFNALLRQELAGSLNAKATRYLTVVDEAALRMNTLIDAMLDLSRTSRLPLRRTLVDLGAVVERARQDLCPEFRGREVRWSIGPLPRVMADQDTLHQVMVNLLSNALKYSRGRQISEIELWAEEREQDWLVLVRDNGAGFDPRFQDRLFGVFQRLHRHDEFEGVGVGLANVRRIVHRHGGQVRATGQLDGGATFGFTLPK